MDLRATARRWNGGEMSARAGIDVDGLMRHLTVVGFAALIAWIIVSMTGLALGWVRIAPSSTLRFLLAVLIVVFSRRTYREVQEWRWRRLPPDERYGFASPIWEHPRTSELGTAGPPLEGVEEPRR
jgi:ABC-type transport system involved in cytochrome bd biosynthesis fused ATPase/permease subunit